MDFTIEVAFHLSGFLPGVEIGIDLVFSSNDFRLIMDEPNWVHKNDVIIEIDNAHLVGE